MAEEGVLALLKTRVLVSKSSEDNTRALFRALERISFAVTYAAPYIAVKEQQITVLTYLKLFHESEEN
ncbi:hypothetical protein K432DRAFT_304654 [Lepidopterella palustris CBS 459.81]|uniref:Uncharacterized protein n=1 Tax=Lepidopterella palustris CBS 459.81 TaxID=1314670 RepID=A0A8E2E4V8_9PEZI|nr:hypothetical protein K432DRAFT_304654 [Lepidopterella palustris CBS 459.81]